MHVTSREALQYISEHLKIKSLDDWNAVTAGVVEKLGFATLLTKYGGLLALLQR